jgi:hypothetical protein
MFTVSDIIHLIQYYYHTNTFDGAAADVEHFRLESIRGEFAIVRDDRPGRGDLPHAPTPWQRWNNNYKCHSLHYSPSIRCVRCLKHVDS